MKKIGFIGLGIMGKPMAKNLMDAGHEMIVLDINQDVLKEMKEYGAELAATPKEIAENSEVIITMLPNSPHVKAVVLGENGVIEGVKEGQVLIDMSSISPLVSQEVAAELEKKGVEMLDAPVSGGQEGAEAGTVAFMVGGKEDIFKENKAILDIMGGSVTLVGSIGAGETTKLVNQVIVGINIAAVAEALSLGKKAGVDPENIFNAIRGGLAGSQCLEDKAPRMIAGEYDPGFKMKLHVKDLTNAFETSRELHTYMPLASQVMEMMQKLLADGHTEVDHGGLGLFYEKLNNISLKKD
ncbi:tartronate semialdehyde reductase [Orenia metallireducens]|uniref:Tartronate semialdehyde reductase n=1 Tax=Orenia metallireducens TaxID=1413210 RepID=A0A285H0L3_9FIRM|nr:2-hydroxy-3-oxopropionate reductase [Orenia metallireducens]PRX21800.1 tartronate semialdehyde reductase [Orenia metallireducens]SNY29094.1 tartronate semialdehyde reductase [Orenia metallireducens]